MEVILSEAARDLIRSQAGPGGGLALSTCPTCRGAMSLFRPADFFFERGVQGFFHSPRKVWFLSFAAQSFCFLEPQGFFLNLKKFFQTVKVFKSTVFGDDQRHAPGYFRRFFVEP